MPIKLARGGGGQGQGHRASCESKFMGTGRAKMRLCLPSEPGGSGGRAGLGRCSSTHKHPPVHIKRCAPHQSGLPKHAFLRVCCRSFHSPVHACIPRPPFMTSKTRTTLACMQAPAVDDEEPWQLADRRSGAIGGGPGGVATVGKAEEMGRKASATGKCSVSVYPVAF